MTNERSEASVGTRVDVLSMALTYAEGQQVFTWSIDTTGKNDKEDAPQCCLVEAEGRGRGWEEVGFINDIGRG